MSSSSNFSSLCVNIAIVKKPILTIEKTVDNLKGTKLIKAGEEFYYNIKVTNKGEVPSSQITITDTLNELLTILYFFFVWLFGCYNIRNS